MTVAAPFSIFDFQNVYFGKGFCSLIRRNEGTMFSDNKKDIIASLIAGEITSWFIIFIVKNPYISEFKKIPEIEHMIWTFLVILPLVFLIGIFVGIILKKIAKTFYQLIKFSEVGILNTIIDFGMLNLLVGITGITQGRGIIILNTLSFLIAVTNSYFWNKLWTFEIKEKSTGKEFSHFLIISIIGIGINTTIVYFGTTFISPVAGVSRGTWINIIKVVATALSMVWNFLGYKLLVFKEKRWEKNIQISYSSGFSGDLAQPNPKTKLISIVIPQYNEEDNLRKGVLEQINSYLKTRNSPWEVIIVDDGSTDNSFNLAKEFVQKHPNFKLIRIKHGGKAVALNAGIQEAKGDILLIADMDQSTPLKEIEKLLPYFEQGFDIVIGSRGKNRKGFSLHRKLASSIFRIIRKTFILRQIDDTQCGFKAFKADCIKFLFPQLESVKEVKEVTGWHVTAFDVELLFMAKQLGYKIKEVPVEWINKDESITKNRKFISESIDMAKQIVNVRFQWLRGKYRKIKR